MAARNYGKLPRGFELNLHGEPWNPRTGVVLSDDCRSVKRPGINGTRTLHATLEV